MCSYDNKSTFYKYLNNKLHSTNSISHHFMTKLMMLYYHLILTKLPAYKYQSVFNKSTDSNLTPLLAIGNTQSSQSASRSFSSYPTTPDVVCKFLCLLPSNYNNSPDGIPKALLKILSFQLCYPLSIIYTIIFLKQVGYMPGYMEIVSYNPNF